MNSKLNSEYLNLMGCVLLKRVKSYLSKEPIEYQYISLLIWEDFLRNTNYKLFFNVKTDISILDQDVIIHQIILYLFW